MRKLVHDALRGQVIAAPGAEGDEELVWATHAAPPVDLFTQ
jgi:hypothetical protein